MYFFRISVQPNNSARIWRYHTLINNVYFIIKSRMDQENLPFELGNEIPEIKVFLVSYNAIKACNTMCNQL